MQKIDPWWLQGPIIAYASSECANQVISKAQFDSALPKNREKFDVPLSRFGPRNFCADCGKRTPGSIHTCTPSND